MYICLYFRHGWSQLNAPRIWPYPLVWKCVPPLFSFLFVQVSAATICINRNYLYIFTIYVSAVVFGHHQVIIYSHTLLFLRSPLHWPMFTFQSLITPVILPFTHNPKRKTKNRTLVSHFCFSAPNGLLQAALPTTMLYTFLPNINYMSRSTYPPLVNMRSLQRWILRLWSSEMWRRVVWKTGTNVSEKHAVSILMVYTENVGRKFSETLVHPTYLNRSHGLAFLQWETHFHETCVILNTGTMWTIFN
jgi:hypothetical protein